ncbi:MAG: hypothetical protein JXI43_05770 [Tissierellales bacterium]|nr:hypothetical protein [Tissierellales bacterium]
MNFRDILEQVDDEFSLNDPEIGKTEWDEVVGYFSSVFYYELENMISFARSFLPHHIFKESKIENLIYTEPIGVLCTTRLRPSNSYYEKRNLPLPAPENPNGYDATGIEFAVSLSRGALTDTQILIPRITVRFKVQGQHERENFQKFLTDHKRLFEIIYGNHNFEMETAGYFDKFVRYKGKSLLKKLDIYYNQEDDEHNFAIFKYFNKNMTMDSFISTFLKLLALYDCVYGYVQNKRNKDRILDHYFNLFVKSATT